LKIDKEHLEDQQVKLTVEIDTDQVEASKRKAAKKIARQIKVPGFRPGKAPYQVIRRQVGDEAILEESLELLVNDVYPKVKFKQIINLEALRQLIQLPPAFLHIYFFLSPTIGKNS